jgi:hypothetical protein
MQDGQPRPPIRWRLADTWFVDYGAALRQEPPMSEIVKVRIRHDELIRQLQLPKDFRIVVHSTGTFVATCKRCDERIKTATRDGLMWYVCPGCKRASFQPVANVERDVEIASHNGGTFECELYFFRELPPGLEPPQECCT